MTRSLDPFADLSTFETCKNVRMWKRTAREKRSLIFEGEISPILVFFFFPRPVKTENDGGGVFGKARPPHRPPLASPTGMKEVTGRNEPEDSRLPPGITSITSGFADDSNPASGHARGAGRSFIENAGRGQFKEKKKKREERKRCAFSFVINVIVVQRRKRKLGEIIDFDTVESRLSR